MRPKVTIIHIQILWQTKSLKSIGESSDNFLERSARLFFFFFLIGNKSIIKQTEKQRSARLLIAPMLANASSRNYKHQWKESWDIYQIELNNNQCNNGDNNNNNDNK